MRIEFDDAQGSHPVVDEEHEEGDVVSQRVEVFGRRLTVRVYYDDDPTPVSERTQTLPRPR